MTWRLYFWTAHTSGSIQFSSLKDAATAAAAWAKEAREQGYSFSFSIQ